MRRSRRSRPRSSGRWTASLAPCHGGTGARGVSPAAVLALQRAAGNAAVARALEGGRPLDAGTRTRMSSAFGGADLSSVRVHTDAAGAEATAGTGARAVAAGEHVAFAPGEFQPSTPLGDALIAHEVAHVLQQRADGDTIHATDAALEQDANRSVLGAVAVAVVAYGCMGGDRGARRPAATDVAAQTAGVHPGVRAGTGEEARGPGRRTARHQRPGRDRRRLETAERKTLDTAKQVSGTPEPRRDTIQAEALEWELAWRDKSWTRLIALSDHDTRGLRSPYRRRMVAATMAGTLAVRVSGGDADWREWVQHRLEDLTDKPVGFQVLAQLLAAKQTVTIKPPSAKQSGKGHTTERVVSDDDAVGRYDTAGNKAGSGVGSTIVLDKTVADNQVVLGGTTDDQQPSRPTHGHGRP